MTLRQKQSLFTLNVAKLIQFIHNTGYSVTFGDAYRTKEVAQIYALQGRGIKDSQHCKRLAIDLNLFSPDGKWLQDTASHLQFGEYWEKLHPDNRWGGRFQDGNHYEMKG